MSLETFDPKQVNITVTDKAIKHFAKKLEQSAEKLIRLSIKKSGCTGYAYVLDYVSMPQDGDELLSFKDNLNIAVADTVAKFAQGTEIDYVLEGVNRVVKFNNPNVIAECGCGESFTV